MSVLDRGEYAARYGPTTGDRVRLADTDLWVEVEGDDVFPGDELIGGCGKTARDGVLGSPARPAMAVMSPARLGPQWSSRDSRCWRR